MTGVQVCLWLVVGLAVVAIAVAILRIVRQDQIERQEADEFLDEANQVMGLKFDTAPREAYLKRREEIKAANRATENNRSSPVDASSQATSWLRNLSSTESAALKTCLVKRAIALQPFIPQLQHEIQARFALLQRGLLNEKQWAQTTSLRDALQDEMSEVQKEAENLQQGYGTKIFQEAKMFYDHQAAKQQHENLKRQLIIQNMANGMNKEDATKAAELQLQKVATQQKEQMQQLVRAQAARAAQGQSTA